MRSALGAARGRIIRQLLTESLVLAVLGGMLGIGVGAAILRAAPALIPPGLLPAAVTPAFDVRVVLFGLAAALAVGVVFGVIPAWQATGGSLAGVMASESRSATSTGRRFRSLLVSGEVAAAVVLLCGAGLLLQTLLKLVGGDTGYRATSESVLTLDFSVPTGKSSRYPTGGSGHTVLRRGGSRRQRAARGAPRRLGVEPAVRHERAGPVGVRDHRRSAGRGARSAERGVHDRRSRILRARSTCRS